jgi:hypothetical protein
LEKKPFAGFISRIIIKKAKIEKNPREGEREETREREWESSG